MCGRYVLHGPQSRLKEYFDLRDCVAWEPRYNIAPQSDILVVSDRPGVGRVGRLARWGLIPQWAKDEGIGRKLSNARAETLAAKPSFRTSFARHRCLIPANGFYEWQIVNEDGRSRKQPWFICPTNDEAILALAGLLSVWKPPAWPEIVSACVITTDANALMRPIHDRMPVILAAEHFATWLDPACRDVAALAQWLRPAAAESLRAWPVSTRVSSGRNEGAELIEPL